MLPSPDARGLLRPGIHDATVEELAERFGAFQAIDRRPRLMRGLRAYLEVRLAFPGAWLIVVGSVVAAIGESGLSQLQIIGETER